MIKVRIYEDRENWDSVLRDLGRYDYVHTYDFHWASYRNGEGYPILFVLEDDSGRSIACWPALKREISGFDFFDLTSVYGYGGPLALNDRWNEGALTLLVDAMREAKVVSLFSRMHPLFNNNHSELTSSIIKVSNVPVIDTELQNRTLETYRKGHRSDIKKLRSRGFEFSIDEKCRGLDSFINLYEGSMSRLGARQYLRFGRRYFEDIVNASDYQAMLSFVKFDGIDVCATLNLITGDIIHGYLTGEREEYRPVAPGKLDYWGIHEWSLRNGIKSIVLGPGRSQENDTLLRFKEGFGRLTLPLHVFKKVINPSVYREICAQKDVCPDTTSYFPAYRTPL